MSFMKKSKKEEHLGDPRHTSVDWSALLKSYRDSHNANTPKNHWETWVNSQLEIIRQIALTELSSESTAETIAQLQRITEVLLREMWSRRTDMYLKEHPMPAKAKPKPIVLGKRYNSADVYID